MTSPNPTRFTFTIERVVSAHAIHAVETFDGTTRQANDRATVLADQSGIRHRVVNPFGRPVYTAMPWNGGAK